MTYEEDILAWHSTPGLRKNEFDYAAKRDHLSALKVPREDADKILAKLFPGKASTPKENT